MSIRRSSKKRGGTLSVAVIVVAFLIVMIFQIVQLKNKETAYAQQTAELNKQLKEETERTDEINALADYMQSDQYIEDMAKSKLGLAYDNEKFLKKRRTEVFLFYVIYVFRQSLRNSPNIIWHILLNWRLCEWDL